MANYSKTASTHQTLAGNTVDTVTLSTQLGGVEVLNRDLSLDLYVRVDGTSPTVGGDDCFIIPAGSARTLITDTQTVQVKLISAGACAYSVTAWSDR